MWKPRKWSEVRYTCSSYSRGQAGQEWSGNNPLEEEGNWTVLWCDKWKSTAATSSVLEVKQLRQLEKGSFSLTTERSINWCSGETMLFQQRAVMGKIAFSCTKYHVHSSVQARTQVLINYWACLKRHLEELHKRPVCSSTSFPTGLLLTTQPVRRKEKGGDGGREGSKNRERRGKSLPLVRRNNVWCRKGLRDAPQYHPCSITLFLPEQFLFSGCSPYPLRPAPEKSLGWSQVKPRTHPCPSSTVTHPDHCTAPDLNGLHSFRKSCHRLWHSLVSYKTPNASLCQWPFRESTDSPYPEWGVNI